MLRTNTSFCYKLLKKKNVFSWFPLWKKLRFPRKCPRATTRRNERTWRFRLPTSQLYVYCSEDDYREKKCFSHISRRTRWKILWFVCPVDLDDGSRNAYFASSTSTENAVRVSEMVFSSPSVVGKRAYVWTATVWENRKMCLIYRVETLKRWIRFSLSGTRLCRIDGTAYCVVCTNVYGAAWTVVVARRAGKSRRPRRRQSDDIVTPRTIRAVNVFRRITSTPFRINNDQLRRAIPHWLGAIARDGATAKIATDSRNLISRASDVVSSRLRDVSREFEQIGIRGHRPNGFRSGRVHDKHKPYCSFAGTSEISTVESSYCLQTRSF